MSDSDDEAAFASADEGDGEVLSKGKPEEQPSSAAAGPDVKKGARVDEAEKESRKASGESKESGAKSEQESTRPKHAVAKTKGRGAGKKDGTGDTGTGKKGKGGQKNVTEKGDRTSSVESKSKSAKKTVRDSKTPKNVSDKRTSSGVKGGVSVLEDTAENKMVVTDSSCDKSSEKDVTSTHGEKSDISAQDKKSQSDTKCDSIQGSEVRAKLAESVSAKDSSESVQRRTESDNSSRTSDSSVLTSGEAQAGSDLVKSPSTQEIQRPKPDHTPEQENILEKLADVGKEKKASSGWGWGNWGTSFLDVASTSVSTFTSSVEEGFNTVLETVESTLNLPSPEEMADRKGDVRDDDNGEINADEVKEPMPEKEVVCDEGSVEERTEKQEESEEKNRDKPQQAGGDTEVKKEETGAGGWFSSWGVSNITNMSKNLVTGSLDVLETIGKKTFDKIKEHDPGLKKTKGLLLERGDKPNLSQMLRDAKEEADSRAEIEKEYEEARKAHFGSLFDEYQGLAHLEALEILSNQSEKRVNSLLNALPADVIASLKPELLEIRQVFEISEEEEEDEEAEKEQDFSKLVSENLSQLHLASVTDKVTRTQDQIRQWINEFHEKQEQDTSTEPKVVHRQAIQALAEITSKSIEQFHKTGEIMLIQKDRSTSYLDRSKGLASLTKVLCSEVNILSTKFTDCLNEIKGEEEDSSINSLVTNIYLEASNSSSYIQDGFQLLLPVLQQAAIESSELLDQ